MMTVAYGTHVTSAKKVQTTNKYRIFAPNTRPRTRSAPTAVNTSKDTGGGGRGEAGE